MPSTTGSAWRAAKAVLKALTTLAAGTLAWICSAAEVPSRTLPGLAGSTRLVVSTSGLPSRLSPASASAVRTAGYGTASTTTSAAAAASRLDPAAFAPVWAAAAVALSGLLAVMVTSWPARTNELASALPTLPDPITAMCMACSPVGVLPWARTVQMYAAPMSPAAALPSRRELFEIPDDVAYLNCSYMAPQLRSVTAAGLAAVRRTAAPWTVTADDFFSGTEVLRDQVARLTGGDADGVAIIPAVSYGAGL